MKVCLIGNNLTNFVLAKVLANKKLEVDIIFNSEKKIINKTRTIGISKNNFEYLKKIFKNKLLTAWPIKNIKIFGERKNSEELMQFTNNNSENFFSSNSDASKISAHLSIFSNTRSFLFSAIKYLRFSLTDSL